MREMKKIVEYSFVIAILLAGLSLPVSSLAQMSGIVPILQVSCYPNMNNTQMNTPITWTASANGGNGSYVYSWSGTDGLTGSSGAVSMSYVTQGVKTASVFVTSGNQSATANCGSAYVYGSSTYYPVSYPYPTYPTYPNYYGSLDGYCQANVTSAQIGTTINWSGYGTGGNGSYTYYWSDSDGYTSTGQYLSRYYTTGGYKNANVTITSNGQSIIRSCSVYIIPSVVVNPPSYTYPTYLTYPNIYPNNTTQNQVLSYTSNNPTLSSVYLSQVPNTGFDDYARPLFFIFVLILWSSALAYMFIKNKNNSKVLARQMISEDPNKKEKEISKDEKDLKEIEDYARIHRVILSTEAMTSLLKLSRLKGVSITDTIKRMQKNDWVAVGEGELDKFVN